MHALVFYLMIYQTMGRDTAGWANLGAFSSYQQCVDTAKYLKAETNLKGSLSPYYYDNGVVKFVCVKK